MHKLPELSRSLLCCLFLCGFSTVSLEGQRIQVLDPLVVQVEGDSSRAVDTIILPSKIPEQYCDVIVLGGGMGGSAAALKAASEGVHVCMTEPTHWIGGQMTSQGISAFDDNELTETTGSSQSFQQLRQMIRQHYAPLVREGIDVNTFNPGKCWVSFECSEPAVDHSVLRVMLEPYQKNGTLTLLLRTAPVKVERVQDSLRSVVVYDFETHRLLRLRGSIFIDATELGEFLPMAGVEYVTGAEPKSQTGEQDAPLEADPNATQSFTYSFVLEQGHSPQQTAKPVNYDRYSAHFSMNAIETDGTVLSYGMYRHLPHTPGAFWTYRRLIAKDQFKPGTFDSDLSMINWESNDVCDSDLLSLDPLQQAKAMQHGKQVSLAFAWWLQHEVPRDDGQGRGYPELRIVPQLMNSADGLSQFPYVRESRRIKAMRTISEEDLVTSEARAIQFDDTVGIGQYPIDIHACDRVRNLPVSKPYQIPLSSLLSRNTGNLLAAAKNIGTTHITNGAYRLHPTEWAIGSAAGATAAMSIKEHLAFKQIQSNQVYLRRLQRELILSGQPLVWFDDLPVNSPYFQGAQYAAVLGLVELRKDSLHFLPDEPITGKEVAFALRQMIGQGLPNRGVDIAAIALQHQVEWALLSPFGSNTTQKKGVVTRGEFANWLMVLPPGK